MDTRGLAERVGVLVQTVEEFDQLTGEALPELLERATAQTRRYLRDTGQWVEDISHEKLALRWGYELLERFLVWGRTEVPCRPYLLLDSLIAKALSQPEPLAYQPQLDSLVGRFLDGLTARAVVSRDALMALFYHLYGLGQGQVVRVLGLGVAESQRVYKNFERWRRVGWHRTLVEIGMSEAELETLEAQQREQPAAVRAETARLVRPVQNHYRKSEPEHFPCLTRTQWTELFEQGYGFDYRAWHLALCWECLGVVCEVREETLGGLAPSLDLRTRPLAKGGGVSVLRPKGERLVGGRHHRQEVGAGAEHGK